MDTTVLWAINVSGADSDNVVATQWGNINGGDFYIVAARPTRVWRQWGETIASIGGLIDIRWGGIVDSAGIIGGSGDINYGIRNPPRYITSFYLCQRTYTGCR